MRARALRQSGSRLAIGLALSLILVACRGGAGTPSPGGGVEVRGTVTAGPICPVERNPPDPACAPRPVPGATIVIEDRSGQEVARVVSDTAGRFLVTLAPGTYAFVPQANAGLRAAAPVDVEIRAGVSPGVIAITYDTGIR